MRIIGGLRLTEEGAEASQLRSRKRWQSSRQISRRFTVVVAAPTFPTSKISFRFSLDLNSLPF
jgi:hypothetical protein